MVVQLGFYHHVAQALQLASQVLAAPIVFPLFFMTFFSLVIALFKDIPDVHGDRLLQIRTFTVRMGVRSVYYICLGTLTGMYVASMVLGMILTRGSVRVAMVGGHAVLLGTLGRMVAGKDCTKQEDLVAVYMSIWKLFYAEYLLIPFAVLGTG